MTPPARIAAAIAVLDRIAEGRAAEQALTNWARGNRFAGSGDRAAIRDLVFDALRRRASYAALAGADPASVAEGRALMIGALTAAGQDPRAMFTGTGYAPPVLTDAEAAALKAAPDSGDLPEAVALDCPEWLAGPLKAALGEAFGAVMQRFQMRAPVFLRVNSARATAADVIAALAEDNISTAAHPLADTALLVTDGAARLRRTPCYLDGRVEIQDAASQAASAMIPLRRGDRVLDYCAGGGGKTLALAARVPAEYHAHDIDPQRMQDLPARAARAGIRVRVLDRDGIVAAAPFHCVIVDAPCSGSGTWARTPEAKWGLTPARLAALCATQAGLLTEAAGRVAPGGTLAYLTCSLLAAENGAQIDAFLARDPRWTIAAQRQFMPLEGGDGFFVTVLKAPATADSVA